MEGCRDYDDSHITNVLLKNEKISSSSSSSQLLDSIWVPNSSPSFHASASTVNFEDAHNSQRQFVEHLAGNAENRNDESDGYFHRPDKKRRLMPNQVQFLEKSFEADNKLEPDRKIQLAKEIGLQPRQVAIWFQNRRARCKTKVLEKEYGSLKASYDKLKKDYESLYEVNEKLKDEVHMLTHKLSNGNPKVEPSDPISPLDFRPKKPFLSGDAAPPEGEHKQDDAASSAKSDVVDSDSPHHSSHDFSDYSQDDEDERLKRTLFAVPKS